MKLSRSLLVVLSLMSVSVFAREVKRARANDVASEYILENDGDFYRLVDGQRCQITDRVESFKVSEHPHDAAVAYFVRGGDLYVLHNAVDTGRCPRTSRRMILADIAKYNVVSNTHTVIVNTALTRGGRFVAWDNLQEVFTSTGVTDYLMNTCFGSNGRSYSSYVAFLLNDRGEVLKLKGVEVASSKYDRERFSSIQAFKQRNAVCQ